MEGTQVSEISNHGGIVGADNGARRSAVAGGHAGRHQLSNSEVRREVRDGGMAVFYGFISGEIPGEAVDRSVKCLNVVSRTMRHDDIAGGPIYMRSRDIAELLNAREARREADRRSRAGAEADRLQAEADRLRREAS